MVRSKWGRSNDLVSEVEPALPGRSEIMRHGDRLEPQVRGSCSKTDLPEFPFGHQVSSKQQAQRRRTNNPRARPLGHRPLRSLIRQIMRYELHGPGIQENLRCARGLHRPSRMHGDSRGTVIYTSRKLLGMVSLVLEREQYAEVLDE